MVLFSVKPSAAISSDLVAAVVMRPIGSAAQLAPSLALARELTRREAEARAADLAPAK
jgi:hypothetical protein